MKKALKRAMDQVSEKELSRLLLKLQLHAQLVIDRGGSYVTD